MILGSMILESWSHVEWIKWSEVRNRRRVRQTSSLAWRTPRRTITRGFPNRIYSRDSYKLYIIYISIQSYSFLHARTDIPIPPFRHGFVVLPVKVRTVGSPMYRFSLGLQPKSGRRGGGHDFSYYILQWYRSLLAKPVAKLLRLLQTRDPGIAHTRIKIFGGPANPGLA